MMHQKVGIIGLDTSHSIAFTKLLKNEDDDVDLRGFNVVSAYPYGSSDIASSANRIPGYIEVIKTLGVQIAKSVDEVIESADVMLLETNDGRLHFEQVLPVLKAGKRVFIDKPFAASLTDVVRINKAAQRYNAPVFSSSSLRFMKNAQAIRAGSIGQVLGADTYSPAILEPSHTDLFWYGIHGVETLFTVMGTGCTSVRCFSTPTTDIVLGSWPDNRVGTFRGIRSGDGDYGGTAFGKKGVQPIGPYEGYKELVIEIANFFRTGKPPVPIVETIEIYTFMEAAALSKQMGGVSIYLEETLNKAYNEL